MGDGTKVGKVTGLAKNVGSNVTIFADLACKISHGFFSQSAGIASSAAALRSDSARSHHASAHESDSAWMYKNCACKSEPVDRLLLRIAAGVDAAKLRDPVSRPWTSGLLVNTRTQTDYACQVSSKCAPATTTIARQAARRTSAIMSAATYMMHM
eukprot:5060881-Amphidinium_carterae.1